MNLGICNSTKYFLKKKTQLMRVPLLGPAKIAIKAIGTIIALLLMMKRWIIYC